jgi:uncharacterized Zn ribbon protein
MPAIRIVDDHLELTSIGSNTHAQIDTHIAAADNYVKRDGSLTLTSNWDIGDTRKILAEEIRARDAAGLKLYDDDSNGIFIADGGQVRINKDLKLEDTISSNTGVIYKGANRFIHNYRDSNVLGGTLAGKNIFIGVNAGNFTMGSGATQTWHGSHNSAMGEEALYSNTIGSSNLAMGTRALYLNTTGSNNLAMGVNALHSNTTGSSNSAMGGVNTLSENTTGNSNSAMGVRALHSNTTGYYNSAIGEDALRLNTTGNSNSAMGVCALYSNTTGVSNLAIGLNAGRYQANGSTALENPEHSVYIGSGSKGKNNDDNNTIVIGYNAVGIGVNTVVLGNDSIVITALKGSVGIGTTTPTALLDVNSDILRLRTAKTPASNGAGNAGDICFDSNFGYYCVSTNVWKRWALTGGY